MTAILQTEESYEGQDLQQTSLKFHYFADSVIFFQVQKRDIFCVAYIINENDFDKKTRQATKCITNCIMLMATFSKDQIKPKK